MGRRRSRPKFFWLIFGPGGYWRRLYSAASTIRTTRSTSAGLWHAAISSAVPTSFSTQASSSAASTSYGGSESVSICPGASSALGGLVIEFSGIGGVVPCSSASALRHRDSSQTSVLGTSLIAPNPPAESPYSVE